MLSKRAPPERMCSVEHLVQLSTAPVPIGRSLLWQVLLHDITAELFLDVVFCHCVCSCCFNAVTEQVL
jgi:hypothetical protein